MIQRTVKNLASIMFWFAAAASASADVPVCDRWQVTNPLPTQSDLNGVAYGAGVFVAVGAEGAILRSADGAGWEHAVSPLPADLHAVAWSGSRFVAVGTGGTVLASLDGRAWTTSASAGTATLNGVASGPPGLVAVGAGGAIVMSADGTTWTSKASDVKSALNAVTWAGDRFLAVGSNGTAVWSATGESWSRLASGTTEELVAVASDGTVAVAVGRHTVRGGPVAGPWTPSGGTNCSRGCALMWNSERFILWGTGDGATIADGQWLDLHDTTAIDTSPPVAMAFHGNLGVRVGAAGHIAWTVDGGLHWTPLSPHTGVAMSGLAKGPTNLVAVGASASSALAMVSPNAVSWKESLWSGPVALGENLDTLVDVASGSGRVVAVGSWRVEDSYGPGGSPSMWRDYGVVRESTDGETWVSISRVDGARTEAFTAVTWDATRFIAVAENGVVAVRGTDGSWVAHVAAGNLTGVASSGALVVAVGRDGTVVRSTDGVSWQELALPDRLTLTRLAWGAGVFVGVGVRGLVMTSADGTQWVRRESGTTADLYDIEWSGTELAAVGDNGTVITSPDGIAWAAVPTGLRQTLRAIVSTPSGYVVSGDGGLVARQVCSTPGAAPSPAFSWQPPHPGAGEPVAFIDLSTGDPTTWQWSFGDGGTASTRNATHVFASPGTYRAELEAHSSNGSAATQAEVLVATACAAPPAPVLTAPAESPSGLSYEVKWTDTPPGYYALEESVESGAGAVWKELRYPEFGSPANERVLHTVTQTRTYHTRVTAKAICWARRPHAPSVDYWSAPSNVAATTIEPAANLYVVPTAASAPGLAGTYWKTGVVLFNPGPFDAPYEMSALRSNLDNTGTSAFSESVVSWGTARSLQDVFSLAPANSSGALLVGSSGSILAMSRTFTSSKDPAKGTYGQYVEGVPFERTLRTGEEGRLIQLTRDAGFRTNVGLANPTAASLRVTVNLFAADGTRLGSRTLAVPPYGHVQETDIIAKVTSGDVEDAFAIVTSATPDARFAAYASVVDNRTGDPILIPPTRASSESLYVPAAAHLEGMAGTVWRTDLEVHNPGSEAASYTIELLRRDQVNPAPISRSFTLAPGTSARHRDVLAGVFGFTGAATLRVTPRQGAVMATARTFNNQPTGTYGQLVVGSQASEAIAGGQTGYLLGLSHSPDPATGFRTNVGLVNATAGPLEVELKAYTLGHALRGSRTYTLGACEYRQSDGLLAAMLMQHLEEAYVTLRTSTPGGRFFAYATVIDNRSGDAIYVPGRAVTQTPMPGEVTLDHRTNAVLVDQLPVAIALNLPSGSYQVDISGSGDLGRADLPIHVVCLNKDRLGWLSAFAVRNGRSEFFDGGPTRCFIPDWANKDDNHGAVQVRIRSTYADGDAYDQTFTLDARANCVLVDRLPEAVSTDRPAAAYTVRINGDLGTDKLRPNTLLLYKSFYGNELAASIVWEGSTTPPILTSSPLVAVVLDWLSKDDNTGSTRLIPVP